MTGPRVVVAGTHSGAGKTTVATGLMAALKAAGHRPASAKVGPDFIDPGYHSLACGRPPRNLDAWLCGSEAIGPLAARAAAGADVLVVEGVMGLFDGAADGTPSSTADVARLLEAPVLLVVDAASQSSSVAAVVHGFATLDPSVRIGGVVLNRVASEAHEVLLREALDPVGIPVLGALPHEGRLVWRDRHLGLVPVAERSTEVAAALRALASIVAERVDLEAVMALASSAPAMRSSGPVGLPPPIDGSPVVAVAGGKAFTFTYADTLEALRAAGAEVVVFDPLRDEHLPEGVGGLLVGGGFPETYAVELSANRGMLDEVRGRVAAGLPTWAECGGLLWLSRELDGHPMAGVIDAAATMTGRLRLGYRSAVTAAATPVGPAGTELRGHEHHYSTIEPAGSALELQSRFHGGHEGHSTPTMLATYLHHHPGGDPSVVGRFASACARRGSVGG